MVHTRIAEGQEGVGRDAGAAHKGAAWSGPTIASPLRALQCPTTASLPERIGPASKRESSSASDLGYQMPSLFGTNLSLLSLFFSLMRSKSNSNRKEGKKIIASIEAKRQYLTRETVRKISIFLLSHVLKYAMR